MTISPEQFCPLSLKSNCFRKSWQWNYNYSAENLRSVVCLTSVDVLLSSKERSCNIMEVMPQI